MSTNIQNPIVDNKDKSEADNDKMKIDVPENPNNSTVQPSDTNKTTSNNPPVTINEEKAKTEPESKEGNSNSNSNSNPNENANANKENNNAEGEIKPPKKRRKKRNQGESGPLSAMKSELLIAARNKLSFDTTKKVRKWVRQPISFNTLSSSFEISIWHSNEPKQIHLDKVINKSSTNKSSTTATSATAVKVPVSTTPAKDLKPTKIESVPNSNASTKS